MLVGFWFAKMPQLSVYSIKSTIPDYITVQVL